MFVFGCRECYALIAVRYLRCVVACWGRANAHINIFTNGGARNVDGPRPIDVVCADRSGIIIMM